ncbi:MAG: hypothetical protein H7263_09755 [Candidatus Sericytochromatia bacterium]|nr:hypothetical protein [Candidatus Sericytochromatia bacterium]
MRKKEVYRTLSGDNIEQNECELCDRGIPQEDLIEISNNKDSTVLCNKCAITFNNLASIYDE